MRRLLAPCACACAALAVVVPPAVPAASAANGGTPKTAPPKASLERFSCRRASVGLNRSVGITAVMHAREGLPKLQLEFVLERKTRRSHRFTAVREGDLGQWLSPKDPTLGERPEDVWMLDKQVVNLTSPAVYRFQVSFRWSGQQHTAQTTLYSRRCDQRP